MLEANVGGLFALKQIVDEHIRRRSMLKQDGQDGHDPAKMPVRYGTPVVSRGARGARAFELVLDNDGDFPKEEEARVADQEEVTEVTANEKVKVEQVPFASLPVADQRQIVHEKVDNMFIYHAPKGDQTHRYEKIRCRFRALAHEIVDLTPVCADQTVALRKLHDAQMAVNLTIACNE